MYSKNLEEMVLLGFLLAACLAVGVPLEAAEHPRMVSAETANCQLCHEDLTADQAFVHDAVEQGCDLCHEMSIGESGTTIELVDSDPGLCLMCHDQYEAEANLEVGFPHYPVGDGCSSCHAPHASNHQHLTRSPANALCADCHDLGDLNGAHSEMLTPSADCASCHAVHGSEFESMLAASQKHAPFEDGSCSACHRKPFGDRARLRSRGQRICAACHGDPREDASPGGSVHAALEDRQGKAGCLDCHQPHLSDQSALLVEAQPELCGKCHDEVLNAAQAETGHAAAADDCSTCHLPHTSSETRLLTEPAALLCANCHDPGDDQLASSHLGADLIELDCLSCHSPHGAGNEHLMAKNLHAPILDGCDLCHEGSHAALIDGGEASLCLMCHDDIGAQASEAAVPHAAMELGSCTECHNPHAASQASLVKLPDGRACGSCHEDQLPDQDQASHGVVAMFGCEACHEPHGGSQEKLLRLTGPELCLACHSGDSLEVNEAEGTAALMGREDIPLDQVRGIPTLRLSADGTENHPVENHRVLGVPTKRELALTKVTFSGELTCLTCHDPHKGYTRKLLNWDAKSTTEACSACHPK